MLDLITATTEDPGSFSDAFDGASPFENGILLHGFGAGGADLAALGPLFPVQRRWIFPHAPAEIGWGGMLYGRAWFPRDPQEIQDAMTGVYFKELRGHDPPGLSDSAEEVLELAEAHDVDWSTTLLGGFSQGAMVAVEAALRAPMPPKGVVLFSGALIAEDRWNRAAEELRSGKRGPERFFQSHGKSDQVLPFDEGHALFELLERAGWQGSFVAFRGGHEIPSEVAREAYQSLYST